MDLLAGTVGESDLRGRLTVDASGERPYLTGDIASRKLNFDDLGPLIGARPKGQKAAAPAKAVAANDAGRVLPDTPLLAFADPKHFRLQAPPLSDVDQGGFEPRDPGTLLQHRHAGKLNQHNLAVGSLQVQFP